MSKSYRSIDFDDEMMHHIFDMDSSYKTPSSSTQPRKKNRMKRMEELSHSLDDGLNELPDDYGRQSSGNRGRPMEQRYDDDDDDDDNDFFGPEYIDDYYYNNSNNTKPFDARPKSYNEKYGNSYMYEDYESSGNFQRNRYSLNESSMNKPRYQQSPIAQQKHSTLRRPQGSTGSSGNGHHGSNKHILFNDEDDVRYMSEKKQSKPGASSSSSSKSKPPKKESRKESTSSSSLFSSKKKPSKEDLAKPEKSPQQVMKAKLKIHNVASDDSVLNTRSIHKPTLQRHHSIEAKLPLHGPDRNNMSPTIMEEIEFEMQDVETETDKELDREMEKEIVEKVKEKPSKEKANKEKKGDSAPSTPTTKKSFKAHLSNHKKLFKVPDIDLNRMKFSCFFSSSKNIAALKGSKKEEIISKSAEALNDPSPKTSPKSSPTTKSPPASPKKLLKSDSKVDKIEKIEKVEKVEEKLDKSNSSRTVSSKTTGSGSTIQSNSEYFFKEEENSGSASDDFEVNLWGER